MVVELRQAVDRVITVGRVFRYVRPRTNHNPFDIIPPDTKRSWPNTALSFRGIQQGPSESLVLFADPELRTTLTVPESEFSSQTVSQRLRESRSAFNLDARVQKSLC